MIKYNNSTINDWYFDTSDIIKVYRNNAVCYYKITGGGDTPTAQTPCYAVVEDISQYSDTEFEDVFNQADGKWYKLNNLNEYEEYGVYGSGRTITTYDGKLTIDDGYEYMYSGGSWVNVGEVSGSTATLPNVPFTLNYNAKNYDSSTHTIPYTEGALNAIDAVITGTTANIIDHSSDGYIELTGSTSTAIRALVGTTNFSRSSSNPNITIICKAYTPSSSTEGNILSNRKESYNWMYRHKSSILTFHGQSEQGSIYVSNTEPNTCSVRIDSNRLLRYNNWTQNTTSTYSNFNYGSNSNGGALFAGYYSSSGEMWKGVFYWIYMSLNTLTDEQVQQVIDYNEVGGGQPIYPLEYVVREDPPNNLAFSSMTEAQEYECPWWGMSADIDNVDYMFCEGNEWLTKYMYIEVSGEYICDSGDKYKKMQEYDRIPDGTTTATTTYVKGDLIESASTDCQDFFVCLSDIVASSTTSSTDGGYNIYISPDVGTFTRIRIDTTKKTSNAGSSWFAFCLTPRGNEVVAINNYTIGKTYGWSNKDYKTDANGNQTFAHWVDTDKTIVEIDVNKWSDGQTDTLYLLKYQKNTDLEFLYFNQ